MIALDKKKSVLVVGGGRWGKNLVRNFHQLEVLHTLCDLNEGLLQEYERLYQGVNFATDYKKALENPAIDKVVIAAPAVHHFSMVKIALEAGKDVFVEKPLCLDCKEGEELVALSQQQKRILMVGHLLHYHPCVIQMHELIKNGVLGKLLYIESNRLNLGTVRTEENVLWSFAPHDFSVILSLCGGQQPEQLRCTGQAYLNSDVADTTLTSLRFANGLRAHIFASWIHPFKEHKMVLVGSSGMLIFDDTKEWTEKLILYRTAVEWKEGKTPTVKRDEGEYLSVPKSEPLRNECEQFLLCCQERRTPKTDGREGLQVLRLLQAAQSSLDQEGESKSLVSLPYFAHPTASVDPSAQISEGTKIWHYSKVMENARIGQRCNIGQNVVISPDVILGNNVKVQNNVSIYTGVTCEDDVFLGPSMVFTNVMNPRSAVSRKNLYEKTVVRCGTTIGANATIICGIELGIYSFIGAGAVVTKDVKPFALMVGNPACQIGWMSRHGEKLDLPLKIDTKETREAVCPATGELYILQGETLSLKQG